MIDVCGFAGRAGAAEPVVDCCGCFELAPAADAAVEEEELMDAFRSAGSVCGFVVVTLAPPLVFFPEAISNSF